MSERTLTLKLVIDGAQSNTALTNYNNQMRAMSQNNQAAQSGIAQLNNSFGQFNSVLNTAVLGISAMKVLDFAADMNRLGQEVNIARQVFTALAGGTQEAASMLELMQQKTNGVVDNLTLMHGASRLLQMGLGDTEEEIAGLTEMAIKLGGALGMDTNKAIEDFSLLLSNMSFLRLDQFGISAGAVRDKVRELRAEFPELTREAAFAQAVLEEGQDALGDLGTAADSSSTALRRFETTIANTMQTAGSNINYATENFLRFIEVLGEVNAASQETAAQAQVAATQAFVSQSEHIINGLLGTGIQGDVPADRLANFVIEAINQARDNPEVWTNLDQFSRDIEQSLFQQGIQGPDASSFGSPAEYQAAMRMWLTFIAQEQQTIVLQAQHLAEINAITTEIEDRRAASAVALAQQNQALREQQEREAAILSMEDRRAQYAEELAEAARIQRQEQEARVGALSGLYGQQMEAASGAGFFAQTPDGFQATQDYASQRDAATLDAQADFAEQQLEYMRDLQDARGEAFFSEEDLALAEEYTDNIRGMADEAQRMADALERASLADIMGQGGGGRVGEISDAVIDQMRAAGMTDEQIAAFQQQSDLASGRQTETSVAFQEQLVPALSEMALTNPQAAIDAMQNFNDVLTEMAAQGIDPDSVDAVGNFVAMLNQMNDVRAVMSPSEPGEAGQSAYDSSSMPFSPQEFVTSLTDSADPAAEIASDMTISAEQSGDFTANMELASGHVLAAREQLDLIVNDINTLSENEQVVKLRFVVDASAIRLAINDALGQFNIGAGSVRDHGGQVPGTNPAMKPS